MRKLKTSDIPVLCRCVKKLGLKDTIQKIALESDSVKDVWARGFDLIWNLFDIATEQAGEMCIYEFLAGPFEMTPEQVRDLDMDVLIENIQHLIRENNLVAFFKFAAASLK
jgi:hypothetical protein